MKNLNQKPGMDFDKIEKGFRLVMEGLGLNLDDPHLKESPNRTAQAWYEELCGGLREPLEPIQTYPIDEGFQPGIIALQKIPVKSICAHHFLPFFGQATVAYLPDGEFCGLSNLSRVVNHFSRRPQMQETLTQEIARFFFQELRPRGVGVVIKASHYCMEMRGVNHSGLMTTSALLGAFQTDSEIHAEFMTLVGNSGKD